jgi:hypothetical protein
MVQMTLGETGRKWWRKKISVAAPQAADEISNQKKRRVPRGEGGVLFLS